MKIKESFTQNYENSSKDFSAKNTNSIFSFIEPYISQGKHLSDASLKQIRAKLCEKDRYKLTKSLVRSGILHPYTHHYLVHQKQLPISSHYLKKLIRLLAIQEPGYLAQNFSNFPIQKLSTNHMQEIGCELADRKTLCLFWITPGRTSVSKDFLNYLEKRQISSHLRAWQEINDYLNQRQYGLSYRHRHYSSEVSDLLFHALDIQASTLNPSEIQKIFEQIQKQQNSPFIQSLHTKCMQSTCSTYARNSLCKMALLYAFLCCVWKVEATQFEAINPQLPQLLKAIQSIRNPDFRCDALVRTFILLAHTYNNQKDDWKHLQSMSLHNGIRGQRELLLALYFSDFRFQCKKIEDKQSLDLIFSKVLQQREIKDSKVFNALVKTATLAATRPRGIKKMLTYMHSLAIAFSYHNSTAKKDFIQIVQHVQNLYELDQIDTAFQCKNLEELQEKLTDSAGKLLQISDIPNWKEKYHSKFSTFRNPTALLTFAQQQTRHLNTYRQSTISLCQRFACAVMENTFSAERYQGTHLSTIFSRYPFLEEQWKNSVNLNPETLSLNPSWSIVDTDDPCDLLLSGTEVAGSCQHVAKNPEFSQTLMAVIMDGKYRMAAIKDESGCIIARCFLRLMWDPKLKIPVLMMEKVYGAQKKELSLALEKIAIKKASNLSAPLVAAYKEGTVYPNPIHSLSSVAPYEYIDMCGQYEKETYHINTGVLSPQCLSPKESQKQLSNYVDIK